MRIGAVIAIVGAHDARNAASRLTMPVSAGSCRAGSWPGGSGDTMNASEVRAAGWPVLTRAGAADGHPASEQRQGRRRRSTLRAPAGARRRVSTIAAALGRGCRQLTPALLGIG